MPDAPSGIQLPICVQTYLKALAQTCAQNSAPLISVVLFGSAAKTLKHSLHSCFFCYHHRTAAVEEEVEFFQQQMGPSHTLVELLALRRKDRRSFAFVIRCLPVIVRLHMRTAWDNRFPFE